MTRAKLSQITVYPVKSVAGISMSTAWVEKQGLAFDRRFMLAFVDGSMITARRFPQMVKIRSALLPDGIRFSAPNVTDLVIHYDQFAMQPFNTTVWKDTFSAFTTDEQADRWFSRIIGEPVKLLYTGEQSNRYREKLGHNVSFADGYPLLLISQGSLDELNRRSPEKHSMAQFRPNLVASDCAPFAEDKWKRIKIGEVEFAVVKPCERCVLTTVDVQTGRFKTSREPLKTLAQFRANEQGGVFFGQNLVALNEGMINQDDLIEVLEYQQGEEYADHFSGSASSQSEEQSASAFPEQNSTVKASQTLTLLFNDTVVFGNSEMTLLEQAERNGVAIANSCRAGLCGTCRVKVVAGEVDQADVPALPHIDSANGMVLACCCVPQSDVKIEF